MLNRLKYSVTFPQTGRTLSADLNFERGFTAIIGPNESGKSMVLEIAQWLLFGAAALRGSGDHYKTLKGEGEFVIRGNIVEITRSVRDATMKRNGVLVATGTKVVNAKVIEELGFGLKVFTIANSINQGEVEALGDMPATARKAMIDNVLGLSVLDNISKWAGEEAKALARQADGMRQHMVPPGPRPLEPQGYLPSESIDARLADARNDAAELATLNGWLSHTMAKPEQPTTKVELPSENLVSLAEKRRTTRNLVETLKAQVNALPATMVFSLDLLDQIDAAWTAYHAYDEEARWAKQNPRPELNSMQLDDIEIAWANVKLWSAYDARAAEAERLRAALDAMDHVTCPECKHEFALHAEHAARLQAELDAVDLTKPTPARLDRPAVTEERAAAIRVQLADYDYPRMATFMGMPPVAKPDLPQHEVQTYRAQHDQMARRAELWVELQAAEKTLEGMADYETMLIERRAYEEALPRYHEAMAAYEAWLVERTTKMKRQAELAGADASVERIGLEFRVALDYEVQKGRYDGVAELYATNCAKVAELDELADEHRKVREVMSVLRGKIKQHVLPSLNLVASQLLRQMTGGQRNLIAIDDDFEVMVDNQELDTLSGSGKAVANLSIRIALGQVLTNRVMSIMLADEIDASMDDFRAEKTSDVLRMLEERVSQVLLVSHKSVEAPHYVRLGDTND